MVRRSSNPQPELGAALRKLRSQRGKTQEALAHGAGVTVAHLSAIERGHANPTWGTVVSILTALDISLVDLARAVEKAN